MKTVTASALPAMGRAASRRRATNVFARPDEEKLRAADLLLVMAEVSSALAVCGLLNWVAA